MLAIITMLIALVVNSLSVAQEQELGTFIFMTPAIILSGYASYVENMPPWLQFFTKFNPLKFYIIVAKGELLKSMPFSVVWHNTWPLMIIAPTTASCYKSLPKF